MVARNTSEPMGLFAYIRVILTLELLCWYRRYFDLDVDDVISPLDETINRICDHLAENDERKEYAKRKAQ
jgi:hypothetical protein